MLLLDEVEVEGPVAGVGEEDDDLALFVVRHRAFAPGGVNDGAL